MSRQKRTHTKPQIKLEVTDDTDDTDTNPPDPSSSLPAANLSSAQKEKLLRDRREADRLKKQQKRANMTPAEIEMERERNRIRAFNKRNSLNEEEKAEYRRKQAEATRLRRRQKEYDLATIGTRTKVMRKAEIREAERLRKQQKRACMTPAELEMQREKGRLRAYNKRNNLVGQDRLEFMRKQAESQSLRRKQTDNELFPVNACSDEVVIPGETYGDRRRRLQRERTAAKQCEQGPDYIESRARHVGQLRILDGVDKKIVTQKEKMMKAEIKSWKYPKVPNPPMFLDPEQEDDLTWKAVTLLELKIEFQDQRNRLCEEALEIELGPNIPQPESRFTLNDGDDSLSESMQREKETINDPGMQISSTSTEQEVAHKRWKSVVNQESNNDDNDAEDSNELIDPCSHVQIKIEAEDWDNSAENSEHERCDEDVPDWIARVLTSEQASLKDSENDWNLAQAASKLHNIISPDLTKNNRRHLMSRQQYILHKEQRQLDELRKIFLQTRQQWIQSKPEDEEKRNQVDIGRSTLKTKIKEEKQVAISKIIKELALKRDVFSQEPMIVREARIALFYESVASNLRTIRDQNDKLKEMSIIEREEKRKQKLLVTKNLTKEETKSLIATKERIRVQMRRAEYDMHIELLTATGFSIPVPKFLQSQKTGTGNQQQLGSGENSEADPRTVNQLTMGSNSCKENFERTFRVDRYIAGIEYWFTTKANPNRTSVEVISYRKMLAGFLSTRRRKANTKGTETQSSTSTRNIVPSSLEKTHPNLSETLPEYECVAIPESQSLDDIQRFKDFITKYGDPVYAHLEYRRFYKKLKKAEKPPKPVVPLCPINDHAKIKKNELARRRYMLKKQGIVLSKGQSSRNFGASKTHKTSRRTTANAATGSRNQTHVVYNAPSNNVVSTSNDGYTGSSCADNHDDEEGSNDDGWVPLGSYEIDSMIRNDILNLGANQQQTVFQQFQQFSTSQQQNRPTATYQQLYHNQHHNPQIGQHLLDNQYNMHSNLESSDHVNFHNGPLSLTQNQPHSSFSYNQQHSTNYGWTHHSSHLHKRTPHQPQFFQQHDNNIIHSSPFDDEGNHGMTTSSPDIEPSSSQSRKKLGGRPKGSKNRTSTTPKTKSKKPSTKKKNGTPSSSQQRDIWGNARKKRRDKNSIPSKRQIVTVVEHESPFERNPEQIRDSMLSENLTNLLPKCQLCDKVVDDDVALTQHITTQHPEVILPPPISAQSEGMNANKRGKRKSGATMESTEPAVACPICNKERNGLDRFVEHIFKCHFEKKQYKCPYGRGKRFRCGTYRFDRKSLRCHILRTHPIEAKTSWIMGIDQYISIQEKVKFWCLPCEKCVPEISDLNEHYKTYHERRRYCCVHCGIYLRMEDLWADHVRLFHSDKKIGAAPAQVEVNADDLFRCGQCNSEFSAQSFLDEHVAQGHALVVGNCSDEMPIWGQFVCQTCDKQFRSEEKMLSHSIICYNKHQIAENRTDYAQFHEPYKCELCKRSYVSLYLLRRHSIHKHQLFKFLKDLKLKNIPTSPKTQNSEDKQLVPLGSSTKEPTNSLMVNFPCPICKTTPHNLHQTHIAVDKLMKRFCPTCDRLFCKPTVLVQHNEAIHGILPQQMPEFVPSGRVGPPPLGADSNDWLTCRCGVSFTIQEFHEQHLFFEKDPNIRTCIPCNKKFYHHSSYWAHMHDDHGVPKNARMAVASNLTSEFPLQKKRELVPEDYEKLSSSTTLQTAAGEVTIFSCKVCLKNFKTLEFLRSHIEESHKQDAFTRVLCKKCNVTFASKANLTKHNKFHHQEDLKRYLCPFDQCGAMLTRSDHFRVHMKTLHPGEPYSMSDITRVPFEQAMQTLKHFVCKICTNSFSTEVGLKSHMTSKHFPTHFSTFCDICGLQMNPKGIKSHIEIHHPEHISAEDKLRSVRKDYFTLLELFMMIQTVYDKFGVQLGNNISGKKKKIHTKLLITDNCSEKSKPKKKLRKDYSSSSDEESASEESEASDDDEAEFGPFYSTMEAETNDDDDDDDDQNDDDDDSRNMHISVKKPQRKVTSHKKNTKRDSYVVQKPGPKSRTRNQLPRRTRNSCFKDSDSNFNKPKSKVTKKTNDSESDLNTEDSSSGNDYDESSSKAAPSTRAVKKKTSNKTNAPNKSRTKTVKLAQTIESEESITPLFVDLDLVKDEIEDVMDIDMEDINNYNLDGFLEPYSNDSQWDDDSQVETEDNNPLS